MHTYIHTHTQIHTHTYTHTHKRRQVCESVGILERDLGKEGVDLLFQTADKDNSGEVDFQEFLSAVVGNLVNL